MSEDFPKSKEEFLHKICGLGEEEYKLAVNPLEILGSQNIFVYEWKETP